MNKRKVLTIIFLVGVIVVLLSFQRKQNQEVRESSPQPTLKKKLEKTSSLETNSTEKYPSESIVPFIKKDPNWQWKRPISFFGKVIDENDNSVAGAQVHFGWNDISSLTGHSEVNTTSDANGLFSLTGVQGKRLLLKVQKEGYTTSFEQNQFSFEYADPGEDIYYKPDPSHPVLFHLQKKLQAEPLIHYQKGFKVPKDGTPVEVDLLKGKAVPAGQGHFKIECWTEPQLINKKGLYDNQFNWKFRITIPNGGLIESIKEFDVVAPENGYRPTLDIQMVKGDEGWSSDYSQKIFIRAANGTIFARGLFEMIAYGDHFFRLDFFVNPSGSRNLEFNPAKEIKPGK